MSTAAPSASWHRRPPVLPARPSTWRSERWWSTRRAARPSTASAAASRGTHRRPASTTRPSRRHRCSRPGVRRSSCSSRCGEIPASRSVGSSSTSNGSASSAAYFGYAFDEAAVRASMDAAGADADRPIKIRLRLSRVGAIEISWAALDRGAPEPVRLALDDVPVDPDDVFLFHKTTHARQVRGRARPPPRRRRRDPHQHARAGHRDLGREHRRRSSTVAGGRRRSMRGSCPGPSARRSSWRAR